MNPLATTTISAIDLINFSQGIAQLNLGYLTISVAILGIMGGVFVYFNFKPLKDALEKQEGAIEELKKEAQGLLSLASEQSEKTLTEFKINQSKLLTATFEQQEEKIKLEITNKIQEAESNLSDKIEIISENKDIKLREIILSETNNRLAISEKELVSQINKLKESLAREISQAKSESERLESSLKELDEEVKELQVYKYSKEGKMGAIIISIDLLKASIDKYSGYKKEYGTSYKQPDTTGESFDETFGTKPKRRLKQLIEEIGDFKLEQIYIEQIREQLARLKEENTFFDLINQLEKKLS